MSCIPCHYFHPGKLIVLACAVVLLGLVTLSGQDSKEQESAAAKKAIRKVLDTQVAAWNKGDLEAFMTGYWKSPELTFFSGAEPQRGWQATIERYRKRYQSEGQEMGKLTFSELDVQVLGPDSALVRGRWQLVRSKDKPGGLFTLIFKRFPEGWRIVHDHTSGS